MLILKQRTFFLRINLNFAEKQIQRRNFVEGRQFLHANNLREKKERKWLIKRFRGQVDRRSFPGAHVQDGGIHGDLISAHTSHCLWGGIQGRSFVISQNLEPTAVSVWCSCSCREYIILVLHRGRPRPSKGPATKTTYIFSTQFQTLKGKRDPRLGPASIIPSTNTLLSLALARQREIRACKLRRACLMIFLRYCTTERIFRPEFFSGDNEWRSNR